MWLWVRRWMLFLVQQTQPQLPIGAYGPDTELPTVSKFYCIAKEAVPLVCSPDGEQRRRPDSSCIQLANAQTESKRPSH
jgi:hypothetical protein